MRQGDVMPDSSNLGNDKCPHCDGSVYDGEHEIMNDKWICPELLVIEDLEPSLRDALIERFGLDRLFPRS